MDKSVDVDFDWVRNVVAEGKTREHGVSTEREDTFLLLDVRRSTDSQIHKSTNFYFLMCAGPQIQ